eukprot:c19277_g1_i3.p1 GENE.c19277_g1_i3~~c19277_g1_i3.p1  ORF type:complete len:169 (+),score=60.56 c19277_g1_i3:159-665(+)
MDTPWPKAERARSLFSSIIQEFKSQSEPNINDLISSLFEKLLSDTQEVPEKLIPVTGDDFVGEKLCAPIFVDGEFYGTRAMTCYVTNKDGKVWIAERSRSATVIPTKDLSLEEIFSKKRKTIVGDTTGDSSSEWTERRISFNFKDKEQNKDLKVEIVKISENPEKNSN